MLRTFLLLTLFSFTQAGNAWAESYYIGPRSGVDVMKSTSLNAKVVQHLPRLTDVKIVWNLRNWSKIQMLENASVVGWVPSRVVYKRYETQSHSRSSSILSFVNRFKRPPNAVKNAALGVRGLDSADIALGKSTPESKEAIKWMESLQVSDAEVLAFVQQGDLNP